jgi:GNAT superfamily N-acetyltransferase
VHRLPDVDVAVFTSGPERDVFNNAVLTPGLVGRRGRAAVDRMVDAYAEAGVSAYAAWVHESDTSMLAVLAERGFVHQETTWAMGRDLDDLPPVTGHDVRHDVGTGAWDEYLQVLELPPGLLMQADPDDFHVVVGRRDGEPVAAGLAFDHASDCGIFNVGTLDTARRRGLASAVVTRLLHDAAGRGCRTATLQSTEMALGVYAGQGFRELGRILEHGPPPIRR